MVSGKEQGLFDYLFQRYRSLNGGTTLTPVQVPGMNSKLIHKISVHSSNDNIVYAALSFRKRLVYCTNQNCNFRRHIPGAGYRFLKDTPLSSVDAPAATP